MVLLDDEYVRGRKVFGQLVCTFRYGREEDEVMGLNFYKELFLASEQIYPPPEKRNYELSRVQVPLFVSSISSSRGSSHTVDKIVAKEYIQYIVSKNIS